MSPDRSRPDRDRAHALFWSKNRRRRALLKEPFPAAWRGYLAANMRHYNFCRHRSRPWSRRWPA